MQHTSIVPPGTHTEYDMVLEGPMVSAVEETWVVSRRYSAVKPTTSHKQVTCRHLFTCWRSRTSLSSGKRFPWLASNGALANTNWTINKVLITNIQKYPPQGNATSNVGAAIDYVLARLYCFIGCSCCLFLLGHRLILWPVKPQPPHV
ncbi:hypothetical protein PR002_g14524 [Phytophthora rubi]|uniref:Uncharacterized protein n=1 Tax=Phytophthora rubi TaxID=129364 RepID=A0A6A3L1E0_9STRA|nr:hypothetical protein PR002_g14524 [Phytophthora rubi]